MSNTFKRELTRILWRHHLLSSDSGQQLLIYLVHSNVKEQQLGPHIYSPNLSTVK